MKLLSGGSIRGLSIGTQNYYQWQGSVGPAVGEPRPSLLHQVPTPGPVTGTSDMQLGADPTTPAPWLYWGLSPPKSQPSLCMASPAGELCVCMGFFPTMIQRLLSISHSPPFPASTGAFNRKVWSKQWGTPTASLQERTAWGCSPALPLLNELGSSLLSSASMVSMPSRYNWAGLSGPRAAHLPWFPSVWHIPAPATPSQPVIQILNDLWPNASAWSFRWLPWDFLKWRACRVTSLVSPYCITVTLTVCHNYLHCS